MQKLLALVALSCLGLSAQITNYPALSAKANIGTSTIPTTTGTIFYVSQSQGLDTNNGTSSSTPWQTIAKINSSTFNPGDQILLYSQDVWHEQLTASSSGSSSAPLTISSYGPNRCATGPTTSSWPKDGCSMPIIDGADVVTGWTVQSGANYKAAYTSTASKGFVDSLYTEAVPLALQTSIANVTSTAGSIYSDGTYVYVHLLDGSNPANHTIEVSATRSGVNLNTQSYLVFDGTQIVRTAGDGIYSDGSANYQTVQNCRLFNTNSGAPAGSNAEGAIRLSAITYGSANTLTGDVVRSNEVGRVDVTPTITFLASGIEIAGSTGAKILNNSVKTEWYSGF